MSTIYHDEESKCEDAILGMLTDAAADLEGYALYSGLPLSSLSESGIAVICTEATPRKSGGAIVPGNWECKVTVGVFTEIKEGDTSIADQLALHRTVAGAARDVVLVDDLEDQMQAQVDGFRVFDVMPDGMRKFVNGNHYVSTLDLSIVCCATEIS